MMSEELYVVICGKRYVRFNLDGSVISCRYESSLISLSRLRRLPFNIELATASGIIDIVKVNKPI